MNYGGVVAEHHVCSLSLRYFDLIFLQITTLIKSFEARRWIYSFKDDMKLNYCISKQRKDADPNKHAVNISEAMG